jgi:transmembrane sensor
MNSYEKYSIEELLATESFVNYLQQSDADDILFWEDFLAQHTADPGQIPAATELFFALRSLGKVDVKALASFEALVHEKTIVPVFSMRFYYRVAGIAALILLVIGTWYFETRKKAEQFQQFAATSSSLRELTLPDGSTVLLNRGSSVSIPTSYNETLRLVQLTGAAFFKVAKNKDKPFVVSADGVSTTAIGTAFYVHPAILSGDVSVSLLEGKVKVEKGGQTVFLNAGERACFRADASVQKDNFDSRQLENFSRGTVQFEKADLTEITNILETYFNLKVVIQGKANAMSFTGTFAADSPEDLLESLSFTYGINYNINNHVLTLILN